MGEGSGSARLTRGERRRNAKLEWLRQAVPDDAVVLGVDLAETDQVAVVHDPAKRLLARRRFRTSVWGIDQMLDFGLEAARAAGYERLVVACEPTGHRWKPVLERCRARGLTLVCVQPLLVHRERERDDYTRDRSDPRDAGLIAGLARDRRCYVPVAPTAEWQRLGHLGARRDAKLEARTAARQQLRDLLACYWPAALAAADSLDSTTLRACLLVSCDPDEVAAMAYDDFAAAVAARLDKVGAQRRNHRVLRAVYAAASDPRKIGWDQPGAAERAAFALADLLAADADVAEVEDRMVGLVDALGYRELAETVPGLSAVGAAAILAETGDPHRYDSARCWAKHAGICPRDNTSGRFHGATKTSGRGRGRLRTAAWRAIWGLLPHNAVFAARYRHLTSREHNRLRDQPARIALANKLLRELWTMFVHQQAWDPLKAAPPPTQQEVAAAA